MSDYRVAKKTKNKKKKGRGLVKFLIVFVVLIVVGILVGTNFIDILKFLGVGDSSAISQGQIDNKKFQKLDLKTNLYEDLAAGEVFNTKNINVLIFGIDRNERREDKYRYFRPDTIMVASINFEAKKIAILSIPRDTRVPIHGTGGTAAINYSFGAAVDHDRENKLKTAEQKFTAGAKVLKGTVSDFLGIPINYYMGFDMDQIIEIVDTIGGVEVDVKTDVYVDGALKIKKGVQVLNGLNFQRYARYRPGSDVARTSTQQYLMKTLFKEVVKPDNIMKVPQLITQVSEMLETDMKFEEMISLGMELVKFDSANIKTGTPKGYSTPKGYTIDKSVARAMFKELTK